MKTSTGSFAKLALVGTVVSALVWITSAAADQTFAVLKSFGASTNITGVGPRSQLIQGPDAMLYGTTSGGEGAFAGTVFKLQPDGSRFTVLKWFTNSLEGEGPFTGLTLSGNVLYGTTGSGGSSNYGTVFKIETDGTGYTVLKHFAGYPDDGANPRAALTVGGGVLYGTTESGGSGGWGTVFKLNTDGTGYSVIKHFTENGSDGLEPLGGLTLSGNILYGTTLGGGSSNCCGGTVFTINTDGTGYRHLKEFTGAANDGLDPGSGLTLSDGVLYGTTIDGGSSNLGTVFKVNTDGTGYSVLREFTGSDGAHPRADLILSDSVLCGTTYDSRGRGGGTVFKVNTDGTGYTVLKHFAYWDGAHPRAGLTLSDGALYGTTEGGGSFGTVFKVNTDGTDFVILKDFTSSSGEAYPYGGLSWSGGALYGTTRSGGSNGFGTVFKINSDGTGYTTLKEFPGFPGDGAWPFASLTLSGSVLYGITQYGGSNGFGTIFKMNSDGTGYSILKGFPAFAADGLYPWGPLTLSGSVLYGTTLYGGCSNVGTAFTINTDGTSYTILKHFTGNDGASPSGGLTLSGATLYGATWEGGSSNAGTVFKMNTDGTGFTVLKHFTRFPGGDGASSPRADLALSSDGVLYGTTVYGGSGGRGTVFRMQTDGMGFTVLKQFESFEGRAPSGGLTLSGSVLFGTTGGGGSFDLGTVFKMNTDGTGYAPLKQFDGSDGAGPFGGLTLSGRTLYGTTVGGGSLGLGTVFKLELPALPSLTVQALGNAIVLGWSNAAFALQAAPAVTGPYTNIPDATSPYTNAISGPQRFFRLVGN